MLRFLSYSRPFATVIGLIFMGIVFFSANADWGFFAHRLINRMAVYTLPPEMMMLYKPNINYLAEHAVDPDKRRYATNYEAVRHYIDLDVWGKPPYDTLPRRWSDAILRFSELHWMAESDTVAYHNGEALWDVINLQDSVTFDLRDKKYRVSASDVRNFFSTQILPGYYDDLWRVDGDSVKKYFGLPESFALDDIRVSESLSEHGILPYHLQYMQRRLTKLFVEGDLNKIISCSSDMGHYIGDAHVPLHTTKNYNGQLTDQLGIHAFWESRIPELFAEDNYDFLVGKAEYIDDPESYYWNMVLESHALVDSVLLIEKRLSQTIPADQQYCFDERLNMVARLPCESYARAYQDEMQGMVEERMRASIIAIGSAWYTAWVDAGQPDFGYAATLGDLLPEWENLPAGNVGKSVKRKHE